MLYGARLLFDRYYVSSSLWLGSRANNNILIKCGNLTLIFEIMPHHVKHHQPLNLFWCNLRQVTWVIVIILAYPTAGFVGWGERGVIWVGEHELLGGGERVHHRFINVVKEGEFLFTVDNVRHIETFDIHGQETCRGGLEERRRWSVYIRWWTRVYIRVRWGGKLMLRQVSWSHEHLKVVT